MKIYVITSTQSNVPLAEIRVEKDQIDFIVDNSNGALPKLANNSFKELSRKIATSSHLLMEEPKNSTVNMFNYLLNNGDVAEISSDGHTVILNGKMLDQDEKDALFAAIKRGDVSVTKKTDGTHAQPIMPSIQIPKPIKEKSFISKTALEDIRKEQRSASDMSRLSTSDYDYEIESADLRGEEDPTYAKRIMYKMKYGKSPERLN